MVILRESIAKMGEYDRFTEHSDSMAKLEVDKIQEFVREEVQRQSSLANETKYQCERHLEVLHGLVEQVGQNEEIHVCLKL